MTNVTFHAVLSTPVAAVDVALFFGDQEYRDLAITSGHNPFESAALLASRGLAIFGRASNIVGESAATLSARLLGPASEANLGGGRTFTHFTSAEGVTGITGIAGENLEVGQKVIVPELRYNAGSNTFLAKREGDIFITELGPDATIGQLDQIGRFW